MTFYDANLSYGLDSNVTRRPMQVCGTMAELDEALDRAGVTGGLVRQVAQDTQGVVIGNEMLAADLKTSTHDLYGMYTILPPYTHEIPAPDDLPAVLKALKMPVLRINPRDHRYLPRPGVLKDYLAVAEEARIPVMMDTACGIELRDCWDIMECFPNLTAIIAYAQIWPTDRMERPFLAQFPNTVLDLSYMITDQGLEDLVKEYGGSRFLFASRFPFMYIGGQQLNLRCAEISDEDKELIAGGNLLRLIREVLA